MQNFTHMYGPLFLAIYAAIFAVFFTVCWVVRSQIDRDDSGKRLVPDVDPDPYKIAYLRGGTNEVLRLANFELFAKQALEEKKSRLRATTWELIPDKISPDTVSPFAWEAGQYFTKPRTPTEIFRSGISSHFASKIREWNDWIENEELRISREKQLKLNAIAILLAGVFAAIGLIKIMVALSTHHNNVGFAIAMLIGGSIAILLNCLPRRFNARGRNYLSAIQTMHGQHRRVSNNAKFQSEESDASSGSLGIASSVPMMAMGLFGVAALQGSSFDGFRKTYLRSEATGGGCGASCGGAASCGGSGTSCGGGASCGGGCGGGGCGGCGG
jgi:uncharacterized protein (TIGR04222 family)